MRITDRCIIVKDSKTKLKKWKYQGTRRKIFRQTIRGRETAAVKEERYS